MISSRSLLGGFGFRIAAPSMRKMNDAMALTMDDLAQAII
jgi:hypothetical protein